MVRFASRKGVISGLPEQRSGCGAAEMRFADGKGRHEAGMPGVLNSEADESDAWCASRAETE